jgi:hypothetical protein
MEQDIYNAGQAEFNLPHDVVSLPSEGLFYKSKKRSVKVGYLTAADENIISSIDRKKTINESIVLPLLRNRLYERDLRPEELLEGDTEAILIFLRNTSFGPEYNISAVDPQTGDYFSATVDLSELNIIKPKIQPNQEGLFEVELPVSKHKVKLKLLTMGDKLEIERIISSYPSERNAPVVTTRLIKNIVELNGSNDRVKISTFVEQMPIKDSKFIRNFLIENEPRLDLSKEIIAPSGEKAVVNIAFGVEFFRPFF